ncbi:PAS domain-containing protein [Methanosarcina sp. MSH10X1]|uniref:PAS domain-containing protein n=1 Tax=Methanosarcina sp. MSH10X1 TaxID=2507075 RepID=UPI0035153F97
MVAELSPKNPTIFLKLGKEGTVLWANRAADALLEFWGIKKGEKAPQELRHNIRRVLAQKSPKNLEIQAGKTTYAVVIYPFPEENYVNLQGVDISFRVLAEERFRKKEKQYMSLSHLGKISLTCKDLQAILGESALLIARSLNTEFSRILELKPDGTFIVRAGYGWKEKPGDNTVGEKSQAEHTLFLKRPIILGDIQTETRFECSEFLRRHGIASGVTVLIGDVNKPFGIMEVYSREKKGFTEDDIYFLDSAAFLLSEIIERLRAEEKLRIHQHELEKLIEKRTLEYTEANEKLVSEVAERRKIEKSLRNSLKFLETLLDTIPAPVFYKDSEGRYLGCNDILARQVLGLEKEEIIGKTFAEAYRQSPGGISLEIPQDDLELLRKGGSDTYEKEITCADGVKRDFLASRATFPDEEGKTRNIVTVLLDVTGLRKAESKLQNNVRFLETLLDSIPSPVFQRDLNEIYVNCNESFARQIMGLSKDEVIGGSFREFQKRIPKELAEIYHKDDRSLIEKRGSNYYETRVICADGVERDFIFHKATYQDSSGKVAGVVGVMLDITQRKEAEKTVRKSEEKYRSVAEQTGQLIYDYDIKSGRIDWAGAISQLTGYSPDEFKQVNAEGWIANIHKEDREKAWGAHENGMKSGGRCLGEYRFKKKDGSYFHVEDSSIYLLDEKGRVYRAVGVIKDITERKLAREILERNEERYRAVAVQTGQLIYDYDVKNNHSSWAGAIEELTGYSFEEVQGFTSDFWTDHVHPEDREKAVKAHANCMERGEKYLEEYRFRRKDGSYFSVEDSGVYLKDESRGIYRVLGVIKDITERKKATEKVRRSEEKYRIAAEQTGQIVYDYNTKTEDVDWAGAIAELTGYSSEEFGRINPEIWLEHIHPDDREKVMENVRLFFEKGERLREEFRFRRKDGSYIYVEDRGILLRDEEGSAYRLLGVMKDITKLKLVQENLEKSEERYRTAAEQTGQIVYDYDRLTGKIQWAGAIKELTQYNLEEFRNFNRKTWETHIHMDDRKGIIEELEKYRERGERFATEYRFRKKDGTYLYVEDSGIFLKDEKGYSYRDIGVMKDITGIKLASKKLKESEERYRSFMKNFRGIAFQGTLDFIPILVDGSVEEITGYGADDFISGKVNWHQIVLPEDRHRLVNNNERLMNNPLLLIEHEYRIRHRNGKIKWVREIIQNVSDLTGKQRILQGAVYDITVQKEAEESLKKVDEIRKKEIHHRIKNNLQVISSLLELQAERFSEKEVLEAFRESQNRVATMAIIHEELYRSRNNETLDFSEYLQKLTVDLLRSYTVRKDDIRMVLDIEETFLGMDTAVPLGIIINELVSNSLKHAFPQDRKGEIRIKLCRAEEKDKNKSISNSTNNIDAKSSVDKSNQYSLVVSDNGLGFPENLDFRNTGSLGLQLVNILVEQLEGTIELQKGAGTTFKILFEEDD